MRTIQWKNLIHTTLGVLLFLFFTNFLFPFAGYKLLIYLCLIFLILKLSTKTDSIKTVFSTVELKVFYIIPSLWLLVGLIPFDWISSGAKSLQNIFYFIVIFIGLYLFLIEANKNTLARFAATICTALLIILAYNLYACLTINSTQSNFSNPHYAAQYAMTSLLLLSYCLLKKNSNWSYLLLFFCTLACGWILINTLSRPAWIAVLGTIGLGMIIFCHKKYAALGLTGLVIVSLILYQFLPDFFSQRINDLIYNIESEERIQIWSDAIQLQTASGIGGWLIGHGPGSYSFYFEEFNTYPAKINFPHNFILEILFESGLLGLSLAIFFYLTIFSMILNIYRHKSQHKLEAIILFLSMIFHLSFAFVTFPFYSKYVLIYQAAFIAIIVFLNTNIDKPEHAQSKLAKASVNAPAIAPVEKNVS